MASLAECAASTVSLPLPDISASLSHTVRTVSDGSSVHTPDSTCAFHHGAPVALAVIDDPNGEAFAAFSRRALRLREHLHRAEAVQHSVSTDEAALFAIAEVHGRRRTWLSQQLCGGAHLSHIGFATPVQSSRLARFIPVTVSSSNMQIASPRLFPVVEESEEDMDVFKAAFPTPVRRHKQVRMRTKRVRHSHAPPGLDYGRESAIELGSLVLQVVPAPPTVMPPPPRTRSQELLDPFPSTNLISNWALSAGLSGTVKELNTSAGSGCLEFSLSLNEVLEAIVVTEQ
jgi:hypothetical protein